MGLIIRNGGSLDGTEIVAILTDKKTVFSVGEIVMFINLFILSSASLVFGWDKAMYSLVAYFVIAKMIDVVLKRFRRNLFCNDSYFTTYGYFKSFDVGNGQRCNCTSWRRWLYERKTKNFILCSN